MKKAITLLLMGFFLFTFNNYLHCALSTTQSSKQTEKTPANPGKELMEGLTKLTSDKNLKSGLHTIFKSSKGTLYCVKLKNGEVDKLIVTSSEGNQIKPKFFKSQGSGKPCIIGVTLSKKPLIEEYWEWLCAKAK